MALTDFSDIFSSVHENAFNNIVLQLQRQRPSLFNYGTQSFFRNRQPLCNDISKFIDQDVINFNNPVIKLQPLLRIPGYDGPFGLEFCLQLSKLSVDFFPNNIHALPPELGALPKQQFSIQARVCAGLGCASMDVLEKLAPSYDAFYPKLGDNDIVKQKEQKFRGSYDQPDEKFTEPVRGIPFERPICFCLDLFTILSLRREGPVSSPALALKLTNLEIVDVKPNGLENSAECYLKTFLIMGVLPKIKLALNAMIFNIANVLTIEPTPVPAGVPFNPAIEDDQIKIFVNLTV